ncbi:longitudinals lacking protein, isoforms H/M/V isoform X1 [Cephus cinctus]|uniref:Longitudinals lacking protein, isoforms H/M/V isoform X1 n=1 Tax=Cephus cinctus TaxID=211228 RepID=A0AAJ7VWU4_CEPCN|nr:longitudinals lacking protein, isoforms H/M/V isoform X1 [Cephus cinctus]XP_015610106.1 longitudinals lacking protein, isoforms H/M/V isoform X1 [Cephus cinctus]XP_015610108.1 longitudinals lacking protein, isoforms H/M/V isoform X1 [Cephus cinctus]XP_015610109.1 longitudinals lacking protein, isoforms H/M/V isoform X1 [Cephus cinctus]XP_024935736.1 longitudinals lacking protein, isoforms H/M/V isoform X1 [Cephus cinctus]XP_024935737.1 longitudinals lacking protein, isoforms H/M/V isoform X
MSMQQFCLRWNNHQPNFISVFSSLLNNETLVDVTLAAEGRHLQAHKVVLSACSTYFQSLFTVNPCQHPIVILKDVKFSDLKIMVDFMYYGEVNVSQDQLPSIIKTAESLKIKGLAEMHTASLTKWPSGGSEPGGGDRGESCSPTPSPLSPSFRRKRLRKTSTGSTSGSGEKQEEINEITLVATNVVKPEPLLVSQESGESLRRPLNTSTESQGSIDEDQISIMSNMESSSANTPAQSEGSMQDVSSQQSGSNVGQSSVPPQPPAHQAVQCKQMGTKRGRLLIRQPRVKKECEPSRQPSPESEPNSPQTSSGATTPGVQQPLTPILNHPKGQEWDEEGQRTSQSLLQCTSTNLQQNPTAGSPSNLLTVPQMSYLVKRHSHPILPSQQAPAPGSYFIHRQHSNPEYPGRTTSPSIVIDPVPTTPSVVKVEESSRETSGEGTNNSAGGGLRVRTTELRRSSSSPQTGSTRCEVTRTRAGSGDQRLGHCPVQRPGPALGCNHCWNTIDGHGRILRRKTKYHCPECQINLCIVPCFQEFHERQREASILRPLPKTSSI